MWTFPKKQKKLKEIPAQPTGQRFGKTLHEDLRVATLKEDWTLHLKKAYLIGDFKEIIEIFFEFLRRKFENISWNSKWVSPRFLLYFPNQMQLKILSTLHIFNVDTSDYIWTEQYLRTHLVLQHHQLWFFPPTFSSFRNVESPNTFKYFGQNKALTFLFCPAGPVVKPCLSFTDPAYKVVGSGIYQYIYQCKHQFKTCFNSVWNVVIPHSILLPFPYPVLKVDRSGIYQF